MRGAEGGARGAGGSLPPEHVSAGRMNDALDGLLDSAEMARLEHHLLACAVCREEYAQLSETVRAVRALPKAAEPPARLWEAIEARLTRPEAGGSEAGVPDDAGGAEVVPFPGREGRVRAARRFALSAAQLAAAALVVSLLSAGTVWLAMRGADPTGGFAQPGSGQAASSAPADPERFADTGAGASPAVWAVSSDAERYADTVRRLEEILRTGERVLAPETLASIEQSLRAIDAAIAEIESALAADPGSDMLRRMLIAHRGTRLGVLERAAAAVRART